MHPSTQSHYVHLDVEYLEPVRLHYLTHGNKENPAVLCVHSLTGNAHDFDFLAHRLAEKYFVIAPDIPGRGLSSHLKNKEHYANEHYLRWTLDLLDHLDVTFVHWVGASMGGIMGMMACASYPFMIRSLMLNDVGSVLAKEGLQEIVRNTGQRSKAFPDNDHFEAHLRKTFSAFAFETEEQWQHFFKYRVKLNEQGKYVLLSDPHVVDSLRALAQAEGGHIDDIDLDMLWCAVMCPVLLFRGGKSLLLRRDTAKDMENTFGKDVTLHTFPKAGHMPNLMTDRQISIIHTWLNKQCGFFDAFQ
jgi:pimeloyl-ACP methyl ester carboxylesterase